VKCDAIFALQKLFHWVKVHWRALRPSAASITNWPLFIFNQLAINLVASYAFGQTHSLTSFGSAIVFLSDLAMCVAVKGWHFISSFSVLSFL
jgi:hypothetical protein